MRKFFWNTNILNLALSSSSKEVIFKPRPALELLGKYTWENILGMFFYLDLFWKKGEKNEDENSKPWNYLKSIKFSEEKRTKEKASKVRERRKGREGKEWKEREVENVPKAEEKGRRHLWQINFLISVDSCGMDKKSDGGRTLTCSALVINLYDRTRNLWGGLGFKSQPRQVILSSISTLYLNHSIIC